jgi:hypothetical protein
LKEPFNAEAARRGLRSIWPKSVGEQAKSGEADARAVAKAVIELDGCAT